MKGEKTKDLWQDPDYRKKMLDAARTDKWDYDPMNATMDNELRPYYQPLPKNWASESHTPYAHYLKGFTEESRDGVVDNEAIQSVL